MNRRKFLLGIAAAPAVAQLPPPSPFPAVMNLSGCKPRPALKLDPVRTVLISYADGAYTVRNMTDEQISAAFFRG